MVRKLKGANASKGGNQQDIIRQAQAMQQEMLKIANGQKQLVDLSISLDVLKDAVEEGDASIVSDLIINAVNEILEKAEEMAEKEMEVVTGGVSIPGLF